MSSTPSPPPPAEPNSGSSRPGFGRKPRRAAYLVALGLLACAVAGYVALRQHASRGLSTLVREDFTAGQAGSRELMVGIHGYTGSNARMADVRNAIHEARPGADVLMLEYPAGTFSNADCFQIADRISATVQTHFSAKNYERIEFVGYSMGALLARKAFVYGWGRTHDRDPAEDAPAVSGEVQPWVHRVKRFVLLAGMNRGWTTRTRPRGMSWRTQFYYRAGQLLGAATDTARLIRQCEAGEPFVANLRMQWLDVMRNELMPENRPTVIQLLGDSDELVSDADNRDVNVSRDFIWVQLSGTRHDNATNFSPPAGAQPGRDEWEFPMQRKRKFQEALGDDPTLQRLRRASPSMPEADDPSVTEAVIVLHGIRDLGEWTSRFEDPLQRAFIEQNANGNKLCVFRPSYGYFPMGSFLLWPARQKNVRWFMDELTELKARYPRLDKLHFIGHSNGTYLLASALRKYKVLKVGQVVFAGSVVRRDFDWTAPALAGRVEGVHNFVASRDMVVGWFPCLFQIPPFTYLNPDLGSAGVHGFVRPPGASLESWQRLVSNTTFVRGAHSAALSRDTTPAIVRFVTQREIGTIQNLVDQQPGWLRISSAAPYVIWVLLIALLTWLGRRWSRLLHRLLSRRWTPRKIRFAAWTTYAALLVFLLQRL